MSLGAVQAERVEGELLGAVVEGAVGDHIDVGELLDVAMRGNSSASSAAENSSEAYSACAS